MNMSLAQSCSHCRTHQNTCF